jgi:phage terminase large subunit-like protein
MWRSQIVAAARQLKPYFAKKKDKEQGEIWDRKPWRETARPEQLPPESNWAKWLILAGRGWGKSRTGAEAVIEEARRDPKARIALVGRTTADVRDVMIQGESGIMACSPPDFRPVYEPSKRQLTWPNGAIAKTYSAEEADQLRGPQHTFAWCDELAAWFMGAKKGRNAKPSGVPEAWKQLLFGLRLGKRPRVIITTTPRPVQVIRNLIKESERQDRATCAVTFGRTYDNKDNLAPSFFEDVVAEFEGTRLGKQELEGIVLDDAPGALWKRDNIDKYRRLASPPLYRVVVAIDPAAGSGEGNAETGIIVAGVGYDGHGYVLDDRSGHYKPEEWADVAIELFDAYEADYVVGETNNGGEMVEAAIRAACRAQMLPPEPGEDRKVRKAMVPFQDVTASRGKDTRAGPIALLAEKGLIHHVTHHDARPKRTDAFLKLEDQLVTWDPDLGMASPDRLDALVWALSKLPIGTKRRPSDTVAPKQKTAEQEFAEARGF